MAVLTYEGVVEAGQIRLLHDARLPEKATVYVVVPNGRTNEEAAVYPVTIPPYPRIMSPHLVKSEDASFFAVEMSESTDAAV